jgi:tRNA-dihydrouridine synthase
VNLYKSLPNPFFALAPLDDVTDTVFRQIISNLYRNLSGTLHVDEIQGTNKARSDSYTQVRGASTGVRDAVVRHRPVSMASSSSRQGQAVQGPDVFFTEFVNVDGLQSTGRDKLLPKLKFTTAETPLVVQIWGKDPNNYYEVAKQIANGSLAQEANNMRIQNGDAVQANSEEQIETYSNVRRESTGADDAVMSSKQSSAGSPADRKADVFLNFAGVDVNMGCPDKTIVKNGCCAALINDRELAKQIINATKIGINGKLPLSVKTRVGFNTVDLTWIEFLLSQNLDALYVHGRTRAQMSKVPNNWEIIGEVVKLRDSIAPSTLIIGNGDVINRQHGEELAKKYNLDGVMIGRGVFNDPFAFAQNSTWPSWTKEQKIELYKKHVQLFQQTYETENKTVRKVATLNKFCKIYINGFEGAKEFRENLMKAKTTDEIRLTLAN